ncbi:Uncharacterized protein FWK35_00026552, partial [Aphis craccivora]
EQRLQEAKLEKINLGENNPTKKKYKNIDQRIKNTVENYETSNIITYLKAGYFWYKFFLNRIKCRGSIVAGYNLPDQMTGFCHARSGNWLPLSQDIVTCPKRGAARDLGSEPVTPGNWFVITVEEGTVVVEHVYKWQGFIPLQFPDGQPSRN